jgi:hypothetical protein
MEKFLGVGRGPVCEAARAERQAHVEVRAVTRFTDGAKTPQQAEHRLVGCLGVGAQGVSAPRMGVLGCVPSQRGSDAAALVGVGDLEPEVEDTRLPADGTGADQRERLASGTETQPAVGLRQQLAKGSVRQMGTAPAAQHVRG